LLGEPFKGKTIVDLGCGSNGNSQDYHDAISRDCRGQYEPWLCRAFHELGVKAIGIDVGNLEGEEFEHHSLDLAKKGSLDIIPSKSVDLVTAIGFFPSTELAKRMYGKIYRSSDFETRMAEDHERSENALRDLKPLLLPQIERILRPEGIFFYD
jgi:hypothetical protein